MSTDTGLELGPQSLEASIDEFVQENVPYYTQAFAKIQDATGGVFSWNTAAALLGPIWGAFGGVCGFFVDLCCS